MRKIRFKWYLLLAIGILLKGTIYGQITSGDGNLINNTINVNVCTALKIKVDFDSCFVSEGSNSAITLRGDSNLLSDLVIRTDGDTLFVELPANMSYTNYTLKLDYHTPNLSDVDLFADGDLVINDFQTTTELRIRNHESGNISVGEYANAYYLDIINHASGDITMEKDMSFISSYEVYNHGSGNYYSCNLSVASCFVQNFGSGVAVVNATGHLNATIFGDGNIEYYGNPANIYTNIFGAGQILVGNDPNCGNGTVSGIESENLKELVEIYPNPASSIINVTNAPVNSEAIIVDYQGHVVNIVYMTEGAKTINVSNLNPGLYMIRINQIKRTFLVL